MNQQPDKFFREKFENYQKPAPVDAWNKIEARLQKKTAHKSALLKLAASLLLLFGIGLTLWFRGSNTSESNVAHVKEGARSLESEKNVAKIDSANTNQSLIVGESIQDKNEDPVKKQTKNKAVKRSRRSATPQTPPHEVYRQNEVKEQTIASANPSAIDSTASHSVAPSEPKSTVTLTFTADETEKYLNKSALAEATHEQKKSSTFKKLWQKANDLKSNQDPVGDLREMKNEILALNFKNEKRGQNK